MWFRFESARFDHTSDLPPDANAGNRFYGRDVAAFIAEGLSRHDYESDYLDEDWGWFVRARSAGGTRLEVAVYHDIDADAATPDQWELSVEERRWWRKHEPGTESCRALESIFSDAGIELRHAPR